MLTGGNSRIMMRRPVEQDPGKFGILRRSGTAALKILIENDTPLEMVPSQQEGRRANPKRQGEEERSAGL
jgi:hypothetical protein